MLRLKPRQREVVADKFPDLANIGAGLFVFGQFVGQQPPSMVLVGVGMVAWAVLIIIALMVAGDTT